MNNVITVVGITIVSLLFASPFYLQIQSMYEHEAYGPFYLQIQSMYEHEAYGQGYNIVEIKDSKEATEEEKEAME